MLEFTFVAFLSVFTLLAVFELCRMLLVYNSLANAARVGVRYASVHGSTNTGTGVNGPSGPGSVTEVENVVINYLRTSLVDTSAVSIRVEYPFGGAAANAPGSPVEVVVNYTYDPFMLLPLNVPLATLTRGIIVF